MEPERRVSPMNTAFVSEVMAPSSFATGDKNCASAERLNPMRRHPSIKRVFLMIDKHKMESINIFSKHRGVLQ